MFMLRATARKDEAEVVRSEAVRSKSRLRGMMKTKDAWGELEWDDVERYVAEVKGE